MNLRLKVGRSKLGKSRGKTDVTHASHKENNKKCLWNFILLKKDGDPFFGIGRIT